MRSCREIENLKIKVKDYEKARFIAKISKNK